jgi:hypothetical protein
VEGDHRRSKARGGVRLMGRIKTKPLVNNLNHDVSILPGGCDIHGVLGTFAPRHGHAPNPLSSGV